MCACFCVWYQIRRLAKAVICVKPILSLMPCCKKPPKGASGTKVPRLGKCGSIISLSKITR